MGWNVESTKSTFNTIEDIKKTISERESVRSKTKFNLEDLGFGEGNYSIVGINATLVPYMRNMISFYVSDIQEHLKGIEATADSKNAFRGEAINDAVQKYMETLKEYCQNLTSQLLAFSDKLKDVEEKWADATKNMAQAIDTSTDKFKQGSQYKIQKD